MRNRSVIAARLHVYADMLEGKAHNVPITKELAGREIVALLMKELINELSNTEEIDFEWSRCLFCRTTRLCAYEGCQRKR